MSGYAQQIEALRERQRRAIRGIERMDRFREADAEFSYDRIEEEIEKLAGQITGEWQLLDASDGWGTRREAALRSEERRGGKECLE